MKNRIPEILKQLPALRQDNQNLRAKLTESNANLEALTKELHDLCTHPEEYMEDWTGENDAFAYRCTACGKIIPEEDL